MLNIKFWCFSVPRITLRQNTNRTAVLLIYTCTHTPELFRIPFRKVFEKHSMFIMGLLVFVCELVRSRLSEKAGQCLNKSTPEQGQLIIERTVNRGYPGAKYNLMMWFGDCFSRLFQHTKRHEHRDFNPSDDNSIPQTHSSKTSQMHPLRFVPKRILVSSEDPNQILDLQFKWLRIKILHSGQCIDNAESRLPN